jgi:hypothetical protein
MSKPSTGLRRRITNCSARCMRKRLSLPASSRSSSSLCLMRTLTRTLFTLGSISTLSRSLRVMVNGCSSSSFEERSSISGRLRRGWRRN